MHLEILTPQQQALLAFFTKYIKKYYLVGGTAIALHLGHRTSIDFDLFTSGRIGAASIKKHVADYGLDYHIIVSKSDQIHFIMNQVKVTFFEFPYKIEAPIYINNHFRLPGLLTLAAMKAFALGNRGKWKDYVDLYFILKDHYSIAEISKQAKALFEGSFNATLFIRQLSYFDDINYDEEVVYMPGFEVADDTIKSFLVDKALEGF
jgi:hypothetical protein